METLNQGIYKITNLVNGKFYIGSSVNIKKRWKRHIAEAQKNINECPKLQKSWNKYGKEAFEFKVVEYVLNEADLTSREQIWLDHTKAVDLGLNSSLNAERPVTGLPVNKKTRAKLSKAKMGHPNYFWNHSEEAKTKISLSLVGNKRRQGCKLSIKHKEAISKASKDYWNKRRQEKNES